VACPIGDERDECQLYETFVDIHNIDKKDQ
jgi:hypothetical protein